MMSGKKRDSLHSDDRELFLREMKGVRRIKQQRIPYASLTQPRPRNRPQHNGPDEGTTLALDDTPPWTVEPLSASEELLYVRNGVQQKLLRKLRRGQLPFDGVIDLHGMTVREAQRTLSFMVQNPQGRCLRIIHGKGYGSSQRYPVLKSMVNSWLRQRQEVLAFCSARPDDGGSGAIYLLLRRQR